MFSVLDRKAPLTPAQSGATDSRTASHAHSDFHCRRTQIRVRDLIAAADLQTASYPSNKRLPPLATSRELSRTPLTCHALSCYILAPPSSCSDEKAALSGSISEGIGPEKREHGYWSIVAKMTSLGVVGLSAIAMRAKQRSHQIAIWVIVGLAAVMTLAMPSAQAQVAEPFSSLCNPIWAKDASATLNEASFSDIMAVPGGNLWVVGSSSSGGVNYAIAEDKDASAWKSTPTHAPANSYFTAVSGTSSKDVWAVGEHDISGHYGTLIEHWNGSRWIQIPSPPERGFLSDVVALNARNAWAVGVAGTNTGYVSLIEHWDGDLWSVVPSPNGSGNNWLNAISGRSGSSIWAVGWHGNAYNKALMEYWDGVDWRIVPAPNPGSTYNVLSDVVDISSSDAWAVGTSGGSPYSTLTEHWNGSRWEVVSMPKPFSGETLLGQVAAMGPRDVWAVGQYGDNQPKGFAENWDGSRWRVIRTPDGLGALTILSGGSVVSAGAINGDTGSPQAIVSQICPAMITDSSIVPVSIWDANWRTVAWFAKASNHSNHTIVDGTGMGLFNSGLVGPGNALFFHFLLVRNLHCGRAISTGERDCKGACKRAARQRLGYHQV